MSRAGRCAVLAAAALAACTAVVPKEEPKPKPPVPEPQPAPQQQPAVQEERPVEPPVALPQVRAPSEAERALAYFDRLRRMPAGELAREHESVRSAYLQSRSDFDRMRLAMMYALPNTALSDEARALDLIEPLVKNARAELHDLAVVIGIFAQENRRLAANVQTLQQGVQALQQKLDALRTLERSMIEREGGAPRRK